MTERTSVYAEEYLALHNDALGKHPAYRPDMKFTQIDAHGHLTLRTRDDILTDDDKQIFEEAADQVARTHKLAIP